MAEERCGRLLERPRGRRDPSKFLSPAALFSVEVGAACRTRRLAPGEEQLAVRFSIEGEKVAGP